MTILHKLMLAFVVLVGGTMLVTFTYVQFHTGDYTHGPIMPQCQTPLDSQQTVNSLGLINCGY